MEEEVNTESFAGVVERLEAILETVQSEDISLDESLTLFEEAAKLGLAACDRSEEALSAQEQEELAAAQAAPEAAAEGASGAQSEGEGIAPEGEEAAQTTIQGSSLDASETAPTDEGVKD